MTVREIAKLANVSASAVSIVLNNRPGVSDETRQRIQAILQQHGYSVQPRKQASDKKDKLTGNIRFLKYKQHGMLVEQNDGFITSVIDAVENEARKRGYNLVMTSLDTSNMTEIFQIVKAEPLDGIIVLGTEFEPKHLDYLNGLNAPLVIIDNYLPYLTYDCIVMNNIEIAQQAVSYLIELGHREIGYFQSSVQINNFIQREDGYRHALDQFGLAYKPEQVFQLTPTMDGAYQDMKKILSEGAKLPTAVFADNDTIAIGAMRALKECGIRVPQDVSIIGFDDISTGKAVDPPLTTMRVFQEEIGRWAVRRLNDKINDATQTVMKIQLGGTIVKRGSTRQV